MSDAPAPFALGFGVRRWGITVALALRTDAALTPDPDHFYVRRGEQWRIVNVRALARRTTLALPVELTSEFFRDAHDDRLAAAARWLARIGDPEHPAIPAPPPDDAPPPWWLDP